MPRLPDLRASVLANMAEQLRFVPAATARRHVARAEEFLLELEPNIAYEEVAIFRRITAYAPEIESPALIPGEALVAELPALIERLSTRAEYRRGEPELEGWLSIAALEQRWSVTRRTLERYRRLGLAGRRVREDRAPHGKGQEVLLFSPAIVRWFEARNSARLEQVRGFSRISADLARIMVRRAGGYRRRLGCSRGQAARRIAARFNRSPDTVRRLLMRHDELHAAESKALFPPSSRLDEHESRLVERAMRFRHGLLGGGGIAPTSIARRIRRSIASVNRIALEQRGRMLRQLDFGVIDGSIVRATDRSSPSVAKPLSQRETARLLASDSVRLGLGAPAPRNVPEFVEFTLAAGWPDPAVEAARAKAWVILRLRASQAAHQLPPSPAAAAIDAIACDLLWAARLKAELVRGEGMLILKTVEARLGTSIDRLSDPDAAEVYHAAVESLICWGEGVDRYDPFKGGRVAAPAGVAINRAISRWEAARAAQAAAADRARTPGRATRMITTPTTPGTLRTLDDWTRRVHPWQTLLEPSPHLAMALASASDADQTLIRKRFGWFESPPNTIADLAVAAKCRPTDMSRRVRATIATVLRQRPA